jgi:hypothetical protein
MKIKRLIMVMLIAALTLSLVLPGSLAAQGRQWRVVKFEGTATEIGIPDEAPDSVIAAWEVAGKTVLVTEATNVIEAQGTLEDGTEVMVLGFQVDDDGSVMALIIRVLKAPARRAIPVFVRGEVTEIDLDDGIGTIVVADTTIIVDADTEIEGELEVGVFVLVRGVRVDDDVLAKFIRVQPPRPAPDPAWGRECDQVISGTVEEILENSGAPSGYVIAVDDEESVEILVDEDTRWPTGAPEVGDRVRACVQEQEDETLLARMIVRIEDDDPPGEGECVPEELEFEGPIQRFPASKQGSWVVGGQHVVVNKTTVIEGEPGIGYHAEVKAVRCGQGVPHAVEIMITAPAVPELETWTFSGKVLRKSRGNLGHWVVGSWEFVVSAGTQISGNPQVGDEVEVTVMRRGHGVLFAVSVTLLEAANGDPPPIPQPTIPPSSVPTTPSRGPNRLSGR